MKKLLLTFLTFFLISTTCFADGPNFHRKTRHKTVKTESRRMVERIAAGYNKYFRDASGVHKTCTVWSVIRKPESTTGYDPKSYDEIVAMSRQNQRQWKNMSKKERGKRK